MLTPEQEAACLRYNFDADSKGDSGVKVLDVRMVTAAKDHAGCFPCMGPIAKGERHRVERAVMDGTARTCRSCAECSAAMAAFQLGTNCDDMEWRYTLGRNRADQRRAAERAGSAIGGVRVDAPTINAELLDACKGAVRWLEGWASAEPYLSILNEAIAKAEGTAGVETVDGGQA